MWLHNDTVLRLQVDDNPEPIKELRRLVEKSIPARAPSAIPGCAGVNGAPEGRRPALVLRLACFLLLPSALECFA